MKWLRGVVGYEWIISEGCISSFACTLLYLRILIGEFIRSGPSDASHHTGTGRLRYEFCFRSFGLTDKTGAILHRVCSLRPSLWLHSSNLMVRSQDPKYDQAYERGQHIPS